MANQKRESTQVQPEDATIVSLVLQSLGVHDYDPKVVQQLLEFAHRYTTDVFQDALVYAEHANKVDIDLEDIQLAIQGRVNHSFTTPPPKEFLLELAEEKNKTPLPLIPEKYGNRLPADKYCLTGLNFSIVPNAPPSLSNTTTQQPSSTSSTTTTTIAANDSQLQQSKRRRDDMEDDDYDF
ncbi:transcription initiation factor IID, 31kD subunit-domain-containing protein [Halteromyces radiatus]|uniref:transcription initiation factor IID, 31kD subunit-domain-containing protein n=1 Tax=Halteromyces radiatus TaxID=101107 RepID=UPI00221EA96E|nr:transcription initiation factor IID, 31kD subunit-domain-containing protein [Halteromyces radiatus]KAI8083152.1 transcription initiation factor IID, 31kD subunit-domain-containing protein [Halteromyces radiatus]